MFHSTLLLLLGSVCVYAASIPNEKVLYRRPGSKSVGSSGLGIYDGNSTNIKKHPYIVVVKLEEEDIMCVASIVSEDWVLLSGDCVCGEDPTELKVIAGSDNGLTGETYSVNQVVFHPKYPLMNLDYDYALVQIEGQFKWSDKVKKIALPKKNIQPGTQVVLAGWGDEGSDSSLEEGKMNVISLKQCSDLYRGYGVTFTERMGCVYNKGKTTLCDGDWSDPATKDNVLYYYFIAIAATGDCTPDALPAICANVYPAVPWIKKVIGTGIE